MKGQNKLELNEETLIEAVQFWLDRMFIAGKDKDRWTITALKAESYAARFIFTIEGPEALRPGQVIPVD